jgi:hypothetical protein
VKENTNIAIVLIFFFSLTASAWCGDYPAEENTAQGLMQILEKTHLIFKPPTAQRKTKHSSEPSAVETPAPSQKQKGLKKTGQLADTIHRSISEKIINSAIWLDSFFANERSLAEENNSYISIKYNFLLEDSYGVTNNPGIDARLILPKLEDKAHLIFSAEPDRPFSRNNMAVTEDVNSSQEIMGTPQTTTVSDKRRFATALQYFLESTKNQSFSIRTGLRFSGMEPVIFGAPRYRLLIPMNSWAFRFTQEVLYRSDTRWHTTTRFDLERPLGPLFFRSTVEGAWSEDTPGYFYNLNFALFQPLGIKNAITYEWINSFQTKPTGKLTDVILKVRYRHNIWRNWIFFDIAPQCRFPSERDHQITPGIYLSLEAVFGRVR